MDLSIWQIYALGRIFLAKNELRDTHLCNRELGKIGNFILINSNEKKKNVKLGFHAFQSPFAVFEIFQFVRNGLEYLTNLGPRPHFRQKINFMTHTCVIAQKVGNFILINSNVKKEH